MSLEDQIGRLANALAMQENAAVAEIIRQRDAAQKQSEVDARGVKYYCERRDELFRKLATERRSSAALRGVITRMKAKASKETA